MQPSLHFPTPKTISRSFLPTITKKLPVHPSSNPPGSHQRKTKKQKTEKTSAHKHKICAMRKNHSPVHLNKQTKNSHVNILHDPDIKFLVIKSSIYKKYVVVNKNCFRLVVWV
jgi:hypothetical protein